MAGLRVVQVVLSLAPGGTERLVIDLVRRTRDRCEWLVCCLDDAGAWGDDIRREGVPVLAFQRRPGFHPALGWRLARAIQRHRADVLHCHHYSPFVYGRIAAAFTGTPLVFTEHGRLSDRPPSRKRRVVNPVLGRLGGRFFAVSSHLREHMIAEGLPASRIGVIHNGIDPGIESTSEHARAARAVLGLPLDSFVVGTAARLDPVKDLATLLSAFAALRRVNSRARLVIFGDGPEARALRDRACALSLNEYVSFTGHRADVRDLLPALDTFANSSISEGISLTILEAMAASVPVVATEVGGTPEIVIDRTTGLLVPSRDPERLAAALGELASNAERRLSFGTAGRLRVLQDFTIERMVAEYVAQYERAARRDF